MNIIILLIAFSLIVAIGFLVAYIWASRDGQFDDDYTPSIRILLEDELPNKEYVDNTNNSTAG